jgi:hypothetical protein
MNYEHADILECKEGVRSSIEALALRDYATKLDLTLRIDPVLQAGGVVLPESPSALPLNFFNQLRGMYGQQRR